MNTMTTTTLRRLGIGTAVAAASVVLTTGAASAETTAFLDARGDMPHGADIHRVRVINDDQVVVRVVHRNLVRSWKSGSSVEVFIDTRRARKGPEFVLQGGTHEGSDYALLRARGFKPAPGQSEPMRCDYAMRLNYRTDVAVVRLSRDCLGNPGAIRVEVKTGGEVAAKDGRPAGTVVDWLGKPRQLTPWVRRG